MRKRVSNNLKPQDVVTALKFASIGRAEWKYASIADALSMSSSEVHAAVRRLRECHLWNPVLDRVDRSALRNFLVHGLRYVFPAALEAEARGVPTGISAAPLAGRFLAGQGDQMVWAHRGGSARGRRVEPLYASVPEAASKDPALHEMLALVDALRVGRARERNLAVEELGKRLS